MICQVGIVVVKDSIVVDRFESLVKPPMNHYDINCIRKHHITPNKTENSPTFDELWPTIEHYFMNTRIVAHNKSFDEDALHKNLSYYGILPMGIGSFDCTCSYYANTKLEALCAGFNMHYDSSLHHSALFDAECCAEFALHMLQEDEPDWQKVEEIYGKSSTKLKSRNKDSQKQRHHQLSGDIFQKDLSSADPNNPFYDRKVVITGEFIQDRKEIASCLKNMGADVDTSITKRTNFVLIGIDPGPKKIEKLDKLIHDGYNIRKIYQHDINAVFAGSWEGYHAAKEVKKDLDLTIDHYNRHHIVFEKGRNVISLKELYYGKGFAGDFDLFNQITGNLGAAGDNSNIYPETNICVLSDSTIERLECGEKDETILYIQSYYNNNKSIVFDFKFLSESEVLRFCKERCESCGDELTMRLYDKYIESIHR